jgi:hypothetical protein
MVHKKMLVFGFFLMISIAFYAQRDRIEYLPSFDKKKLHYGFYLGINQNDFKLNLKESAIQNANITIESTFGFNVV